MHGLFVLNRHHPIFGVAEFAYETDWAEDSARTSWADLVVVRQFLFEAVNVEVVSTSGLRVSLVFLAEIATMSDIQFEF